MTATTPIVVPNDVDGILTSKGEDSTKTSGEYGVWEDEYTDEVNSSLRLRSFVVYALSLVKLHSPFTRNGRTQIKKTVLVSGPAEYKPLSTKQPQTSASYSGWRFGSIVACIEVGACLVLNVLFSVLATAIDGAPNGIGTLYEGNCKKVHSMDTWMHVALNVLATMLIGASNYTMQCLSAPSRSDVNKAHVNGTMLDIGVPSIRNFRYLPGRRIALWAILCCSTIPLHLLWNSAIFSTLQSNNYLLIGVATDLLHDTKFKCPRSSTGLVWDLHGLTTQSYDFDDSNDIMCDLYESIRDPSAAKIQVHRLESKECIEAYDTTMQTEWSNLAVVYDSSTSWTCSACSDTIIPGNVTRLFNTNYVIGDLFPFNEYHQWYRDRSCEVGSITHGAADHWYSDFNQFCNSTNESGLPFMYNGNIVYQLEYCLATKAPQFCRLQFSLWIMIVVILCNSAKLLATISTLKVIKEDHLITLGDAVSSFLDVPDPSSIGFRPAALAKLHGTSPRPKTATLNRKKTRWTWLHSISIARLGSTFFL